MKSYKQHIFITPRGLRMGSSYYPCSVGRNATTARKVEGDGATPEGRHHIIGLLYRPDRMRKPTDWAIPIRPRDIWSDDSRDPNYNMIGRSPTFFSHEKLFRADRLYDMVLLTDWNWPYVVKGRGSAIFIHRWRKARHPTYGCIALHASHLLEIAQRVTFGTQIIVLRQDHVHQK